MQFPCSARPQLLTLPCFHAALPCMCARLVDDGGDSLSLVGDGSNGKCVMYARMATLEQVRLCASTQLVRLDTHCLDRLPAVLHHAVLCGTTPC